MATGNNKILKINGLLLHFTDSYNTVKNSQIGSNSTLTFHHVRHLKRICDKDNQYFFSAIAEGIFKGPRF